MVHYYRTVQYLGVQQEYLNKESVGTENRVQNPE